MIETVFSIDDEETGTDTGTEEAGNGEGGDGDKPSTDAPESLLDDEGEGGDKEGDKEGDSESA